MKCFPFALCVFARGLFSLRSKFFAQRREVAKESTSNIYFSPLLKTFRTSSSGTFSINATWPNRRGSTNRSWPDRLFLSLRQLVRNQTAALGQLAGTDHPGRHRFPM